ncbi:hypothetical protein DSN97_09295 [Deferribacteraceae bacterium V6Fe1]|nr:hypothetical protein DSN97_09295 [Deferribacteraceae bacterium V6Fe1]
MSFQEIYKVDFSPIKPLKEFPVFIDYDFQNRIPRGLSIILDIFYGNFVYDTVNSFERITEPVFIKKQGFFLPEGFFLVDFKNIKSNSSIVNFINSLKGDSVYFEHSSLLNNDFLNLITKDVYLMEFV